MAVRLPARQASNRLPGAGVARTIARLANLALEQEAGEEI